METQYTPTAYRGCFFGHTLKASLWELTYWFDQANYINLEPGADVAYEWSETYYEPANFDTDFGIGYLEGKAYTFCIYIGNLTGPLDEHEQVEWRILARNPSESLEAFAHYHEGVRITRVHVANDALER
jgi:hypothetical protein